MPLRPRALYWPSIGLGVGTLILLAVNVFLVESNQTVQAEVNQRQQFINQTIQLSRVNEVLVRMLANAAVSANDDKLRDLLAQQGITVTVTPGGAATTGGAPQAGTSATPTPAGAAPATATPAPEKKGN
jgi:hypothetical protein